ncbi:hypothetical protein NOLU111490_17785 [Novosphingobium lubricantis]
MSALNGVPEGQRVLTADEVLAELQKMKLEKNCQPERIAYLFASGLALEGRDLLDDAVCHALTSRSAGTV